MCFRWGDPKPETLPINEVGFFFVMSTIVDKLIYIVFGKCLKNLGVITRS